MIAPRLLQCTMTFTEFDLQVAEYTKDPDTFISPPCRIKDLDPFNAVVDPGGMLRFHMFQRPTLSFNLDLPDLKQWRKDDQGVWLRCIKIDTEIVSQVWPNKLIVTVNNAEIFRVEPPEEGHVRRDVPKDISPALRPGMNSMTITVEDPHCPSFAIAVVRTQAKTGQILADETPVCEEEDALERVNMLLRDTWTSDTVGNSQPDPPPPKEESEPPAEGEEKDENVIEDDDEVTCVLSNRLKLRCPLSFERVDTPVRGEACVHLQCFGLNAYLDSNSKMRALNNRWTCPVCSNILKPADLRVDKFVQKVLSETPSHVEEVVIQQDGTYKVVEEEEDAEQQAGGDVAAPVNDAEAKPEDNQKVADDENVEMTGETTNLDQDLTKRKASDDGVEAPLSKRQKRRKEAVAKNKKAAEKASNGAVSAAAMEVK